MGTTPQVLHRSARAIHMVEFFDALQATCAPRFPTARGKNHRSVALAVSGGVDSMALAYLCSKIRRSDPMFKISDNPVSNFHGLIVDHGLREGSDEEAKKVRAVLNGLNIKCQLLKVNWKDAGLPKGMNPNDLPNIETLARQLRYRRIGRACSLWRVASVLTAHHEDDQYETVLMRLLSGHGYRGLQGMRPATDIPECYDQHGVYQSGFIDDQMDRNPFYNHRPSKCEKRMIRTELRNEIDPAVLAEEIRKGLSTDVDPAYLSDHDYEGIARGRRAPPLAPMDIEDGGVTIYRPLLQFGKDRLMQTCLENGIPWFEDHTNTDPTLTMRNAVRHMCKNHELPVALQKPAVLRLAENCRRRCASEEAETDRLVTRTVIHDFEPNVGTAVVELPKFSLPTVPRSAAKSDYRRQRRIDHYRHIAALLIRRLLSLVTPEREITPVAQLDQFVSMLFPSLAPNPAQPGEKPKAYVLCGVHFIPLIGDYPLRWLLTRAPHVSNVPRPAIEHPRLSFRHRWSRHPRQWKISPWFPWKLFDGRYWIRVRHRFPVKVRVAPYEVEHQKPFREALRDDNDRNRLAVLLKRYAPAKVRYTLPAIYAMADISGLLKGGSYWPPDPPPPSSTGTGLPEEVDGRTKTRAEERQDLLTSRFAFDAKVREEGKPQLLALPTLGIQIPGLDNWVNWELRYRKGIEGSPYATKLVICLSVILLLQLVAQEIGTMFSTAKPHRLLSGLLSAHTIGTVTAAVDLSWHKPAQTDINNLTAVATSESSGVYGFIYNTSQTPDERYGVYNWCNMPHVRKTEYVKPSSEYELVYVELMHRHHKRTPYSSNAFPIESYPWNCDDQGLFYYGKHFNSPHGPAAVYWKQYISPISPFVPSGWIGTCQFPQITSGGLDDSWQHGADLFGVYHDLLGFLPSKDDPTWRQKVVYRVTTNQITSQVAGMVINGMFGAADGDVPVVVQAAAVDSLEPTYACPVSSSLFNTITSSPAWQQHLTVASGLYATLDGISGVSPTDPGFHASFDHYYDNLSARQCHAKPLPCKLVNGQNDTGNCITQQTADAVYRFGNWEYAQIYRDAPQSLAASAASLGVWVAELAAHLRAAVNGTTDVIYYHNIAHDGSVSRLLSILQVDTMVWPGMGSEVVFELYKKQQQQQQQQPPCTHNNCLRAMLGKVAQADAFCSTYVNTTAISTTGVPLPIPTWLGSCNRDARAVSSACKCVVDTATATSAPTPSGTGSGTASVSGYYVRVLWGGKVLRSSNPSLGVMDMLPVETLLAYFDGLVGVGASLVAGKCNGSIPV
ncbi:histidine phosphatase superfamily [Diplogelasinospora grovesii]|uniref:tRNA(Ile)-lysidine synthetase n=1 Tax=Diplogelasinospora grovesii TaxID=303347 RepID=A0AAN6NH43_9PEZI|nr:histidine phosphatase superfamily [Diplogelasinospora grovesii]